MTGSRPPLGDGRAPEGRHGGRLLRAVSAAHTGGAEDGGDGQGQNACHFISYGVVGLPNPTQGLYGREYMAKYIAKYTE